MLRVVVVEKERRSWSHSHDLYPAMGTEPTEQSIVRESTWPLDTATDVEDATILVVVVSKSTPTRYLPTLPQSIP